MPDNTPGAPGGTGRGDNADDFGGAPNPEGTHFSDEELQSALEGFEKQFDRDDSAVAGFAAGSKSAPGSETGFDDELQGLIGNKAKVAVIITRLASAQLLAAFCQLSDISADCVAGEQGAVAVLHNLDADAPEAAAKDLTTVVSGMAVALAVNRADKLDAYLYLRGEKGQRLAPPILFSATPAFAEDLLLGITTVGDLRAQGMSAVDSMSMDRDHAMKVISDHTRFGRGKSGTE